MKFLLKGVATYVPLLDQARKRRARTGGTSSARYCYSIWLRHLVLLNAHGFDPAGARVAELGPGDSVGVGLAALLSGAASYSALDVVEYGGRDRWLRILDELALLFEQRQSVPGDSEFPGVRPLLSVYDYPAACLRAVDLSAGRLRALREDLAASRGRLLRFVCPWSDRGQLEKNSVELLFSQAVLEHVVDLEATYAAMYEWVRPGGLCSHVVDFRAHHVSREWNGHWRFPELLWRLASGRREFTLNRRTLTDHLTCIRSLGFEVLHQQLDRREDGVKRSALARPFRDLPEEDLRTSVAHWILRRPLS